MTAAAPSDSRVMKVKTDTWMALNALKRPTETFDDVIKRLLSERAESEGAAS